MRTHFCARFLNDFWKPLRKNIILLFLIQNHKSILIWFISNSFQILLRKLSYGNFNREDRILQFIKYKWKNFKIAKLYFIWFIWMFHSSFVSFYIITLLSCATKKWPAGYEWFIWTVTLNLRSLKSRIDPDFSPYRYLLKVLTNQSCWFWTTWRFENCSHVPVHILNWLKSDSSERKLFLS